jgi:hypothetical protein
MFTDSFWSRENEIAYQAINGGPSPVARRNAANLSDEDVNLDAFESAADDSVNLDAFGATDDDFELDPTPYLLERREWIAEAIPTATGRELAALIGEMNRINEELRECGYFPPGV